MAIIVDEHNASPFSEIFKRIDSLSERCFIQLVAATDYSMGDVITDVGGVNALIVPGAEATAFGIVAFDVIAGEDAVVGYTDLVVINDSINTNGADTALVNDALLAKGIKQANDFSDHKFGEL